MATIRITKSFRFEMAHALAGYDGLCKHVHGHSYELFVTVAGQPIVDPHSPKTGMVMDFGDLKKIVRDLIVTRYDHALVISEQSRKAIPEGNLDLFGKVMIVNWQPSSENLLIEFASLIREKLPASVSLHSLRLHETATSFSEWFASDNP